MQNNKIIDQFLAKHIKWSGELKYLRKLMNCTEMEETIKWGMPTYTINNKNIVGLGAFKAYVSIWFFQGVFLKDPKRLLINTQEGKTKGMRQWRFDSLEVIDKNLVHQYVNEAIANHKAGKQIKSEIKPLIIVNELATALSNDQALGRQFELLSLSSKREYADYIREAKKEATKYSRLEKIRQKILEGKGLYDKYK